MSDPTAERDVVERLDAPYPSIPAMRDGAREIRHLRSLLDNYKNILKARDKAIEAQAAEIERLRAPSNAAPCTCTVFTEGDVKGQLMDVCPLHFEFAQDAVSKARAPSPASSNDELVELVAKIIDDTWDNSTSGPTIRGNATKAARAILPALTSHIKGKVEEEREACARRAIHVATPPECDYRGMMDPETGEVPCELERREGHCECDAQIALGEIIAKAIRSRAPSPSYGGSFQERVAPWMQACFGPEISADKLERNDRFIEEALELVQASDYPKERAHQLVEYVYGRDRGEINQEVGAVMVTLAAHCLAHGVDMHAAAETELARIWTKVEAIRAKQAAKPKGSALPIPMAPTYGGWEPIDVSELRRAVEFFDKVQAASEGEKIAVGTDHWDWLLNAARALTATPFVKKEGQ